MKKIDPNLQLWQLRRQRRAQSLAARVAGFGRQAQQSFELLRNRRWRTVVLRLPTRVTAERSEDRAALVRLLRALLGAVDTPRTKVKLDFSGTVRMFPGGMLLLVAYLELMLESRPGRIHAKCAPGSLAAQLFSHFGLADRLGIPSHGSTPRHGSVVTWRYLTGTVADGAKIAELINSYRQLTAADIPEGLYDTLAEALTNVRHHAYPDGSVIPEALQRWWLFARYVEPTNSDPGSLFIGVYDIGEGIQTTLREKLKPGEAFLERAGRLLDLTGVPHGRLLERILLEAAVDGQRSRTGQSFRGNGLPEMREFVLKTNTGRLSIVSGSAQYLCMAATGKSSTYTCSEPVIGTLILWSIPLVRKEGS